MTGRRHTQSRLRLAGSGVQPLLLMFPLGLFWMAFVFDLATTLGAPPLIGTVAFWNLVAGLIGGLLAALAAAVDAFGASDPAAARIFFLALLLDVGVLIVFAVLTLMRVRGHDRSADGGLIALEAAGLALAGFTAWFSGRLADPQAPVSDPRLSHRRGAGLLDLDPPSEYPGQQSENAGRRSEYPGLRSRYPGLRSESAVPRSESPARRTRDSSRVPADPGAWRKDPGTSSSRRRETAVPAPRPSHGWQAAGHQPTPPQRGRTAVPDTRGRGPAAVEREAGGQAGAAVGREPEWWGAVPGSGSRGDGDSGDEWESGRPGGAEPPQWPAPAGRAVR
ncbi:DUF2231 domain-containing protein [Actinoplanes campanulatus]|uniref:DUF2231 domain-containing protein n=2 Tax=Actinoplanes campanulatus TaxID=113559 RepID=UPI001606867B|nr:DUF2231 domain-containing protein [Actinoplanes campanulatus]